VHQAIAKITKPTLGRALARPRLFERLDAATREHPITWIGAPAGSGKTVLAATWLQARRRPCLWYQLDARDADPAAFFYFVRAAAARLAPRKRETLPLLTPEYAHGLDSYARSFFEQLSGWLRPGTVIVLDDFQELPEDAPLQQLMPAALSALPDGIRVIVASRVQPPAAFARLVAHQRVSRLGSDELALSGEEGRDLARLQRRDLCAADADAVWRQTDGWLAGTVLLLEQKEAGICDRAQPDPAAPGAIFEYFTAELFDRATPRIRRFLLETALLPRVTLPAAAALTGEASAPEILAELVRRNLFTVRLAGADPCYRYHPLFREFLVSRARAAHPPDAWRALLRRASEVLAGERAFSDAAQLMIEAEDHGGLAALALERAPAHVRHGRSATIESWLRALPPEWADRNGWVAYWLGVCRAVADPQEARGYLERAYRAFRAADDPGGSFLAWAGFVNTFFYVWDRFGPLDAWIGELEDLLQRHPTFPSLEIEAQVTFGMMASLMWRRADHPRIGEWIDRAERLLRADLAPEMRMQLATYLAFFHLWWRGHPARCVALLEDMRPLLDAPDLSPQTELMYRIIEAAYHARVLDRDACFAAVERGLARADATGVVGLSLTLAIQGIYGALGTGDVGAGARYLRRAASYLGPDHATNVGHYHHLGAWISLCAGDLAGAEERFALMSAQVPVSGAEFALPWQLHIGANLLVERGRHDEAVAMAEQGLEWARPRGNLILEHQFLMVQAWALLAAGRDGEAIEKLRPALAIGREHGIVTFPFMGWRPAVAARLAALAVEHGVEAEHVRAQIQTSRLAAPESAVALEAWPWPVRVRTLGAFELWRKGERVIFRGKVQRKPLDLLFALVAFGGRDVREEAVTEALWPEADGDAARHALESTLYRLRKLLGVPGVIVQRDRKLTLDPRTCFVDALALEAALSPTRKVERSQGTPDPAAVVQLYRGPFLAGAADLPWTAPMRGRLRVKLARWLDALEQRGAAADARRLRLALAEVDPALAAPRIVAGAA
jgi:ATP/maltotriose-dependent transcriptional regulator MalT